MSVESFGKYQLRERIAVGGMAEVFDATLASAEGFERRVAIKRILPQFSADESFVAMFVDEAKIAAQLSHSNIAQVLELGCVDGAYFIAMEFVEGKDLRTVSKRLLAERVPVPLPIACYVVSHVAEALAYAHDANGRDGTPLRLTHRDLSPHNIMLTYDGGVKVIDFGLAKAMGRVTHTRRGVLKGKLAYMSPEQSVGDDVDARSDLFSLGSCFFEFLTGVRLFLRETQQATVKAVQAAEVPSLRAIIPTIPFELEAIVSRCLVRDPEGRYQTAQELHEALQAFVHHAGLTVGRRTVAAWLAQVLTASSTGFAGVFPIGPNGPTALLRNEQAANEPRRRRITEDPLVPSTRAPTSSSVDARAAAKSVPALEDQPSDAIEIDVDLDSLGEGPAVGRTGTGIDLLALPPTETIQIRAEDLARLVQDSSPTPEDDTWDNVPDTEATMPPTGPDPDPATRPARRDLTKTDPRERAEPSQAAQEPGPYRPPPPSRLAGGPRRGD